MSEDEVKKLPKNLTKLSPSDIDFAVENLDLLHRHKFLSSSVSAEERVSVSKRRASVSPAGSFNSRVEMEAELRQISQNNEAYHAHVRRTERAINIQKHAGLPRRYKGHGYFTSKGASG